MRFNRLTKATNKCSEIAAKTLTGIRRIIENPASIKGYINSLTSSNANAATYKMQGYHGTCSLFYSPTREWGDPMYDSLPIEYLTDLVANNVTHIGVVEEFGNQNVYRYYGFHNLTESHEVPEGFEVFEIALLDSSNPNNPDDHYFIAAEIHDYYNAYNYDISALIHVKEGKQAERFREMIKNRTEQPVKFDKETMTITLI